jgi:hypothetical protein
MIIRRMTKEKTPKNAKKYKCDVCDFVSRKESEWDRHVMTVKHQIRIITNEKTPKNAELANLSCNCGKHYKHSSSLWNHKKKCNLILEPESITSIEANFSEISDKKMIMLLVQKNYDLQSDIMELLKKGTTHNTNNNTRHTNNNTFNLQFFLNETCKDAMNLTDFVKSISIQLSDLDKIGESGFVIGISDIIVKELNSIDVTKRPVHCSDARRETMYVRDADKWEKEGENRNKLHNMIDTVSKKNLMKLSEWKEPGRWDGSSTRSEQYNHIILGSLDNSKENNNKIIRTIAKEVKI